MLGVEDLTQEMGEGNPPDSKVLACSRLVSSFFFHFSHGHFRCVHCKQINILFQKMLNKVRSLSSPPKAVEYAQNAAQKMGLLKFG